MLDDIKLCEAKYHEYLTLAHRETDPDTIRVLINIGWSWLRLVRQLERYTDKKKRRTA